MSANVAVESGDQRAVRAGRRRGAGPSSSVVSLVLRAGGRLDDDHRGVARGVGHGGRDRRDAGLGAQPAVDEAAGRRAAWSRSTASRIGPLAPGPNSAATRSYACRVVFDVRLAAGVLRPGPHAEDRRGQQQQERERARAPPATAAGRRARPSGRSRCPRSPVRRRSPVAPTTRAPRRPRARRGIRSQHPVADQPAQRGHQRDRGEHDRADRGERGVAERRVHRQAGQPQPEQRDQHGRAGEDHRRRRRWRWPRRGRPHGQPGPQALDVPGDEQQRVVDADADGRPSSRSSARWC